MIAARFRAKRKAHLAEVEQQINHLEGRSTTLQRQVEDLKKENAFLKVRCALCLTGFPSGEAYVDGGD